MPTNSANDPALSTQQKPGCSGCVAWIFAIAFLGVGLIFTFVMAIQPLSGMLSAQGWVETPCQIVSSDLKADGDSSSLDIVYTYTFSNQPHQSNRFCFVSISSNTSTGWKRQVVADHPPGKQTVCYVNPKSPTEAVIHRGWVPDMWWMFFPLPFVAIGFGALLVAVGAINLPGTGTTPSGWRPNVAGAGNESPDAEQRTGQDWSTGPVTLKPQSTPLQTLIIAILIAAFWNGIVSVFVVGLVNDFQRGGFGAMSWFLALFLTPFVLIGVALIGFTLYSMLALFNPRPTLVVDSSDVPLGEELTIAWHLSGRTSSIRDFKILLKGTEKATYQRGTTTTTDSEVFATIVVIESADSAEIEQGSTTVTIPQDSMHSFDAPNNKIVWTLELRGDIPLWPDVSASFPITVLPHVT